MPEISQNLVAISICYGGTSHIIIPAGTPLPTSGDCSIELSELEPRQYLEVFKGTRKLCEIPLSDYIRVDGGSSQMKITAIRKDLQGPLEMQLTNIQQGWQQTIPISLCEWDQVDCTVFSPPEISAGDMYMVQAWVHLISQITDVEKMAKEYDKEVKRRGTRSLTSCVARGSVLTFHLLMPGLHVQDEVQDTVWHGWPTSVQFSVSVPEDYSSKHAIGTVTVSLDGIPIGQVKFKVEVIDAGKANRTTPEQMGEATSFELFFISYA